MLQGTISDFLFLSWNLCQWDDLIPIITLNSEQQNSETPTFHTLTFDWCDYLLPARIYKNREMWPTPQNNKL